jgi:AcrR family transcriptional regulator
MARRGKRPGKEDELPRSLAVLWKRTARRRRALSLEQIVAAAIEIADAEGLAGLSMARVAERLGCATMSLYRHVASKDELQVFMMDAAPGPPPLRDEADRDWRAGLARWARELRAVYLRHPWVLQILGSSPPLEPGQLAWLDSGLAILRDTRLRPGERLSVIMLVLYYVRGEAQLTSARAVVGQRKSAADDLEVMARYGRTLARLVDAERFPALAEVVAAGVFDPSAADAGPGPDFEFGLARVLDGIEALSAKRRR